MAWRTGSAFTALSATGGAAITVTTTTPIAAGERVILVVWRVQAATGTAAGNPIIGNLGGQSWTTDAINETFSSPYYNGLSLHSLVAAGPIASGSTFTVTPGNSNQKTAAMMIVQADPHGSAAVQGARIVSWGFGQEYGSGSSWPGLQCKGMNYDARLSIALALSQSSSTSTPWVTVNATSSTPTDVFTEVSDNTAFGYGFFLNVLEKSSGDKYDPDPGIAGLVSRAASPASAQIGIANYTRAGATLVTAGSHTDEGFLSDTPSRVAYGSGASRPAEGQLWPRRRTRVGA